MPLIPWRTKNFISEKFPLLYHLAVNLGRGGNSAVHWDQRLADTWDADARKWPTKTAIIAALVTKDAAILDVGCGNGSILRDLKRSGYVSLHGLEISDYAIRRLGEDGIEMHKGVLPRIALPDKSFDLVIASQVLEHIIRRRFFIKEIHRVLKVGGQALIFVPDDCLGPIDEPEHVVKFNHDSLRRLLEPTFSIQSIETIKDENHKMPVLFARISRAA